MGSQLGLYAAEFAGGSILITGAGGSIGSEICRKLARCHPRELILLEQSELALHQICQELTEIWPQMTVMPILGSVTDSALLEELFESRNVDVVLHAAAYKHVPLLEDNLRPALHNNVRGTVRLAKAARKARVARFVLISSDKAVRPKSRMGASKRLSEIVLQDMATRSGATCFSIVRFGNVLGSSGSVVPRFEAQIAAGGPVTVTDPHISRYLMTVSEAVDLVLTTTKTAQNGDINVLTMGPPVRIATLAERMIRSAGKTPQARGRRRDGIAITYVGLRPGEKLSEELSLSGALHPTPHPRIHRAPDPCPTEIEVATLLRQLDQALKNRCDAEAAAVIDQWATGPVNTTAEHRHERKA
ncbi:SDR family NAD(P)-dependent oxidoreductase [Cognatishimia sp. SS12]|nr:SDR family NAD(P)-dependent oxidoreductase [Cognatishimia sp. SS12]MDC0737679.1 SDR family NAD(P)-dependent oxidoreductase [Cognatishimia sp. SS12]